MHRNHNHNHNPGKDSLFPLFPPVKKHEQIKSFISVQSVVAAFWGTQK
jgi:hypothetical protein